MYIYSIHVFATSHDHTTICNFLHTSTSNIIPSQIRLQSCNCTGSMHTWLASACSLLSVLYVASPSCPNSAHSTCIHRTHLFASPTILFRLSASQCQEVLCHCFLLSCHVLPFAKKEGALLANVSFLSELLVFSQQSTSLQARR